MLFQVLKPFIIGLTMMFFLQMSGFNVMVFYCVSIFQDVGSTIDPYHASIIVGGTLLVSCFVALAVVSQMGRKVILVMSIFGMSTCHILLGTCYHLRHTLQEQEEPPAYLGWLPLVAVIGFLFLGNIGYGTLIWVVTAELLPPKVCCSIVSLPSKKQLSTFSGSSHGQLLHHMLRLHHRLHCGQDLR